jgi:assimilatory nitrate reductase catalytic subunit
MDQLAARMGRGQYFPYQSAREIFDELRVASRGGKSDYYGITYEKIDRQNGVFWPCPTEDSPGTPRLHTERFAFPDGRARMSAIHYQSPVEEPSDAYPFRLTTGRVVYQYLSGNQTRRLGFLNSQAPEPWVEVHPQAAEPLGIKDGDRVRVRTPRNEMELRALVVPTIRPDVLFIPFHYGHRQAVNQLTNPVVEPTVKIPEYKACAARLERLDAPDPDPGAPTIRITPEDRPAMFPYILGEVKDRPSGH